MQYDIGIYFEANGHGTVLFSAELKNKIDVASKDTKYVIMNVFTFAKVILHFKYCHLRLIFQDR